MKRIWAMLLLGGVVLLASGCDELEDVTIELGGWGLPYGYGGYVDPYPSYSGGVWVEEAYEEEYIVEEVYYDDPWYGGDWFYW